MASRMRLLSLPSKGEEIQNKIASGAKYKVCWIRVLMRFFLGNSSSIKELLEMLLSWVIFYRKDTPLFIES